MSAVAAFIVFSALTITRDEAVNRLGKNEYELHLSSNGTASVETRYEHYPYGATGNMRDGRFIVVPDGNGPGSIIRVSLPNAAGLVTLVDAKATLKDIGVTMFGTPMVAPCKIRYGASVQAGTVALYRYRNMDVRYFFDKTTGTLVVVCLSEHKRGVGVPFVPD